MVTENDDDTNRHRTRRLTEVATRLTQLRHRNADQRHATRRVDREAERRVKTALKAYAKAEVAVRAVERDRDDKAASLVQQIKQTREAAQVKIDELRHQQVMAMWQIGDAGRTAEQIADLLEIPLTETRRLLGAGHTTVPSDATTAANEPHADSPQLNKLWRGGPSRSGCRSDRAGEHSPAHKSSRAAADSSGGTASGWPTS